MKLSSTNADNLRTKQANDACIFNCKIKKNDIACIQETHNGRNGHQIYKVYAIYYCAADKAIHKQNCNNTRWANNWRGGVELIIKNDYGENIKQMNRIRRIIEIKLKKETEWATYLLHVPMRRMRVIAR